MRSRNPDLTPREQAVAELLKVGISNRKRIGARLGLTEATVRGYLHRIYEKLGVHDSTAAAVLLLTGKVER